jgi:actin
MWYTNQAIIIDGGSGMMRAGFAGNAEPGFDFANVVGRPKSDPTGGKECFAKEAYEERADLSLSYPVTNSIIQNWDDMTKIWEYTYSMLMEKPTDQAVFLTESLTNPMENREKTAQIFFETFQVPAFYLQPSAPLALYACGRDTGVVFDCGESVTQVIPVYDGQSSKDLVKTVNFAGGDVTRFLGQVLTDGSSVGGSSVGGSSVGADYFQDVKENKCYVALDYDAEMKASENDKSKETSYETSYELPDGELVPLGNERFRCPEALFNPSLMGKEFPGVHKLIHDVIQAVPEDWNKAELYENIILSGGSTMCPGFKQRLANEVQALADGCNVQCPGVLDTSTSVWIGGSV